MVTRLGLVSFQTEKTEFGGRGGHTVLSFVPLKYPPVYGFPVH